MWKFFMNISLLVLLLCPVYIMGNYPKLSCYYLDCFMSDQNSQLVSALSKYDLVILDMEMSEINPTALLSIRQLNPNVKLLAYMTCQEISTNIPNPIYQPLRYSLRNSIQDEWWLRTATGEHTSFWQGTWMLNCTPFCPEVNGFTWIEHFADFINNNVLNNPLWDGFFLDNCWSIVPYEIANIDCNNDGIVDNRDWLDSQWILGMEAMLNQFRIQNPTKILIGNGGYEYGQYLNGVMFEGWDYNNPNFEFGYDWSTFMNMYNNIEDTFVPPVMNIIQAMEPNGFLADISHFRFTLTTALMGSAYYAIDLGPSDHSDTWWFDEYDSDLGEPLEGFVNPQISDQPNLLINGEMNSNLAGWELAFVSPTTGYLQNGFENNNSFAICNVTYADGNDYSAQFMQYNNPNMDFQYGNRYLVTFKAKSAQPRTINFVISKHLANWEWVIPHSIPIELNTDWTDYIFSVTSQNTSLNPDQLRFSFNLGNEPGIVYFDDISLRLMEEELLMREFENGLVICNPYSITLTAELAHPWYHLNGSQDHIVNNGQICTSVSIPAYDGIILRRTPLAIFDSSENIPKVHMSFYPNPAKDKITLYLEATIKCSGRFCLYNLKGQKLRTEILPIIDTGKLEVPLSLVDNNNRPLSKGIYIGSVKFGEFTRNFKLLVLY